MTVAEEFLFESAESAGSNWFEIPPEFQDKVHAFIEEFDKRFSPEASELPEISKELHGARLGHRTAELAKYKNDDGFVVRSLEVVVTEDSVARHREVVALSVLEGNDGKLAADKETFTLNIFPGGRVTLIPGPKEVLTCQDYNFLENCTPRLGRRAVRQSLSLLFR